jgi:hypothetical protein
MRIVSSALAALAPAIKLMAAARPNKLRENFI